MKKSEILSEVRSIAEAMAIPRLHPGEVSPSLKYRVTDFQLRAGVPFKPWQKGRQYLTKPGTIVLNGQPVTTLVHRAVVDDIGAELCREISARLSVVHWQLLREGEVVPEYRDWTPDRAEQALREAAAILPTLCDQLEGRSARKASPQETGKEPLPKMPTDKELDTYKTFSAVENYLMVKHNVSGVRQPDVHRAALTLLDKEIDRAECGISEGYSVQREFDAFIQAYRRAKRRLSAS
jgi:hypothetical protein